MYNLIQTFLHFKQLQKGLSQRKKALFWNRNTGDEEGGSYALHNPNLIGRPPSIPYTAEAKLNPLLKRRE